MLKRYLSLILAIVLLCATAGGCKKNETVDISSGTQTDVDADYEDNSESEENSDSEEDSDYEEDSEPDTEDMDYQEDSDFEYEDTEFEEDSYEDSDSQTEDTELMAGAYVNDPVYENSEKLYFFVDEALMYNFIRPEGMDSEMVSTVRTALVGTSREINGERPNYISDSENLGNDLKNIFVGETSNPLSAEAKKIIEERNNNFYDYIIMVKDGNVVIYGATDTALTEALNFFIAEIFWEMDSYIPADYYFHYAPDVESGFTINKVDINSFVIECEENPAGMVYKGCEELQSAIKNLTDCDIPIIVGSDHGYEYTIKVYTKGSDRKAYSISYAGKSLVLNGGTDYALNAACHYLATNISAIEKGKKANIPATYKKIGKYTENTYGTDGYRLLWTEEFDGAIDETLWEIEDYTDPTYKRIWIDDNVSVKDSVMTVTCDYVKGPDGTTWGSGGHINTGRGLRFAYGYFEIRSKVPKGKGNWPAFWAVGANDNNAKSGNPEIDVYEFFGSDNSVVTQLHTWWLGGRKIKGLFASDDQIRQGHIAHLGEAANDAFTGGRRYKKDGGISLADEWHTYGCEWTPAYMKFYCDGYNYLSVDLQSKLTHAEYGYRISPYLAFSNGTEVALATGNSFYITDGITIALPDETTEVPSKYYVDYIRLYQMDNLGTMTFKGEKVK